MYHHLIVLLIACVLEACFSYPEYLYKWIKHPVVWIGAVIAFLDRYCNKSKHQRLMGIISILVILSISIIVSLFLQNLGILIEIVFVAILLAGRSLYEHVDDVLQAMLSSPSPSGRGRGEGSFLSSVGSPHPNPLPEGEGIFVARAKLSKIVGRDVAGLNESEICKATIETLAESFSDGFVAPIFWAVLFGLPGIACYKAINTADSMIGHKTERYINFGWAAARLDDLMNYIPARISAFLLFAYQPMIMSISELLKEAKKHASPNSGYPEAVMAGTLEICLGGKRSYDGVEYNAPLIGEGLRTEITTSDLQKAIQIYVTSCKALWVMLLMLAVLL